MKPAPFDYVQPENLQEVIALLQGGDEVKILAGGQSLIPLLNMRLARPALLVALRGVPGLDGIETTEGAVHVGALACQERVRQHVFIKIPGMEWIGHAMAHIGHPQTRAVGTVGGSLAHADPSAELPLLLAVAGGSIVVEGPNGKREIAAEDFFLYPYTTALGPDEVLVGSTWPKPSPTTRGAFREFSRRRGDFAIAAVACLVTLDEASRVVGGRLGAAGVAGTPVTVAMPPDLAGKRLSGEAVDYWISRLDELLDPPDDMEASSTLRRRLVKTLAHAVLLEAGEGAKS